MRSGRVLRPSLKDPLNAPHMLTFDQEVKNIVEEVSLKELREAQPARVVEMTGKESVL